MTFVERPISLTFVLLGLGVVALTATSFVRRGRLEASDD